MSYKNISRKCSVCECCGSCDYEYEVENDCVSGDFSPLIGAIRQENRDFIKGKRLTNAESISMLYSDPINISDEELDKIVEAFIKANGDTI